MRSQLTAALALILALIGCAGGSQFEHQAGLRAPGPQTPGKEKEIGTKYNIALLTASVPVSFSEIRSKDGKVELGPKMGIGGGVSFVLGKAVYHGNSKVTVNSILMVGFAVETGAVTGEASETEGRLAGTFTIGLGPVGVAIGHDILNETRFYGINARIEAFDLLEDAFLPFKVWR